MKGKIIVCDRAITGLGQDTEIVNPFSVCIVPFIPSTPTMIFVGMWYLDESDCVQIVNLNIKLICKDTEEILVDTNGAFNLDALGISEETRKFDFSLLVQNQLIFNTEGEYIGEFRADGILLDTYNFYVKVKK